MNSFLSLLSSCLVQSGFDIGNTHQYDRIIVEAFLLPPLDPDDHHKCVNRGGIH